MPASNSLAISKFLGKDRYEHYVQELTAYGTLGGTQLTSTQRKQAFVIRNNKIKFEKFVDTLLAKKTAAIKTKGTGPVPGPKSGAIVKSPTGAVQKYMQTQQGALVTAGEEQDISAILQGIDDILKSLRDEEKNKKASAELDRKKREEEKRKLLKSKLKKGFENLKKVAEKVLAPVKGILQKIIDFILNIFIGRLVYRLIEWWGDPSNREKVQSIIRFLGDHWPKLLSLYLLFGTQFGRFALGLTKTVAKGAVKLLAKIALLAAAKKVGGARKFARFLGGGKGKLLANVVGTGVAAAGSYALVNAMKGDGEQKVQGRAGGGYITPKIPAFFGGGFNLGSVFGSLGGMFGSGMNAFSGFVSGEKGVDKVPAMLSDGEFVMSRGAVEKYGVNTLEAMNAAGGGTNKPKMVDGTAFAAGGGFIGKAASYLKHDEALSSLTKGTNDFIKPGGKSVATGKDWSTVTARTPLHSYVDSVGQPTIGWGSTFYDSILNGKKPVKPGDTITKAQADMILNTNIANLAREYSKKIPTWPKMTDDQKAGVILVGYNAPNGPIGAYKRLTEALKTGNMIGAARESHRGGPSAERLAIEKRLILSGSKDLSKAPTQTQTQSQPQQNFFQKIQSGVASMFGRSEEKTPIKEKYGQGGYAPKFAPMKPRVNNITPLPRRGANVSSVQGMNMGGGGYGMSGSSGGSTIPAFSATAPGNDRSNKLKTLGVM